MWDVANAHAKQWEQERADAAVLRESNETLMLSLTNERETTNVLCERIRLLEQAATRVRDEIDDRTHGATYSECSDWWNILLDVLPDSPAAASEEGKP